MNKNTLWIFICILFYAFVARTSFGEDNAKYSVANIWEAGSYTLRQDCFISLITSIDKKVVSKDQTQVLFTWHADVSELQEDGVQKMNLQAARVMLRYEVNNTELTFFDSSNESSNSDFVNEVFRRFTSASIEVVFKNGEIENVSVKEDVWKGFQPEGEDEKAFFHRFQSLLDKETFKQIFDPFFWVANQEDVAVKDEWSNDIVTNIQGVGNRNLIWNCKLDSVKKAGASSYANVTADSSLDVEVANILKADLKASLKVKFNTRIGSPIELESRTTVSAVKKSGNSEESETNSVALQRNNLTVAKR